MKCMYLGQNIVVDVAQDKKRKEERTIQGFYGTRRRTSEIDRIHFLLH